MTKNRRKQWRVARRRYYWRNAERFARMGLTTRGTIPRRRQLPPWIGKGEQQRQRRREFVLAGLTTRGTRRQLRLSGALNGLTGRARRNAYINLHRRANYALGLTARGTPLKYRTRPRTVNA